MRDACPPNRASASRIAARSTTAGTPVKSWSSTRLVRKAISCSFAAFTSHDAIVSTSDAFTKALSSLRRRFSSRILRLNGSLSALPFERSRRASSRYMR